jgi:hypothetical protein
MGVSPCCLCFSVWVEALRRDDYSSKHVCYTYMRDDNEDDEFTHKLEDCTLHSSNEAVTYKCKFLHINVTSCYHPSPSQGLSVLKITVLKLNRSFHLLLVLHIPVFSACVYHFMNSLALCLRVSSSLT